MIVLIRAETENSPLEGAIAQLDDIEKALRKILDNEGLTVHDEHYERIDGERFKGRRVWRYGEKVQAPIHTTVSSTPVGTTNVVWTSNT